MWRKIGYLLLCIFLWLILSSVAFSQSEQAIPRNLLSIDSLRAKTIPFPPLIEPAIIVPATIDPEEPASGAGSNLGPSQPDNQPGTQWVSFRFSSTRWFWEIRGPGTYGGKIAEGVIESNGGVLVDFSGFGNLGLLQTSGHLADNYYAVSHPSARIEDLRWMSPSELNAFDIRIDAAVPGVETWALWHRVEIDDLSPANDFDVGATISMKLQNNFPFVEMRPELK